MILELHGGPAHGERMNLASAEDPPAVIWCYGRPYRLEAAYRNESPHRAVYVVADA